MVFTLKLARILAQEVLINPFFLTGATNLGSICMEAIDHAKLRTTALYQ